MRKLILLFAMCLTITSMTSGQEEIIEVPGRIAYIGADANVYVLDVSMGHIVQLTNDAGERRQYQWPTWANNNKLAFFCCDPAFSQSQGAQVYVSADGSVEGELVYESTSQVFTYAAWAPSDCTLGDKCRDLAVLLSGAGAFVVQLIRSYDTVTTQLMGQGSPFYYSWSPEADRLILQRNGRRLDVYSVMEESIERLVQSPGAMQAPAWSPVDERLLFGALDSESRATDLVIANGGEIDVIADNLPGRVASSWSPDGRYVAYRTLTDKYGDLLVYDTESKTQTVQPNAAGVISFFWSPDSSKIAFVTFDNAPGAFNINRSNQQPDRDSLVWWMVDIADDQTTRLVRFVPTVEMIYILNFFDQFAQSHRLWSPDSTHLVFAEERDDRSIISVLDTSSSEGVSVAVADGVIGIWSYR